MTALYLASDTNTAYLSRGGHHHHHLLQVELVPGQRLNGDLVLDLAAGLAGIVEELPQVANPGLQQDELR